MHCLVAKTQIHPEHKIFETWTYIFWQHGDSLEQGGQPLSLVAPCAACFPAIPASPIADCMDQVSNQKLSTGMLGKQWHMIFFKSKHK